MILKLIYLDDLPYERIAEIYDITSRTVDNVVRRFKNVSPIFRE
jgi:DNA-directed RNA polymerase specialized sigma24 family protein